MCCCQFYHTISESIDVDGDGGTIESVASASKWLGKQELHAVGFGDSLEDIASPFLPGDQLRDSLEVLRCTYREQCLQ